MRGESGGGVVRVRVERGKRVKRDVRIAEREVRGDGDMERREEEGMKERHGRSEEKGKGREEEDKYRERDGLRWDDITLTN